MREKIDFIVRSWIEDRKVVAAPVNNSLFTPGESVIYYTFSDIDIEELVEKLENFFTDELITYNDDELESL